MFLQCGFLTPLFFSSAGFESTCFIWGQAKYTKTDLLVFGPCVGLHMHQLGSSSSFFRHIVAGMKTFSFISISPLPLVCNQSQMKCMC